jgi:hypothetical protein
MVHPIYEKMGISPEVAKGLQKAEEQVPEPGL